MRYSVLALLLVSSIAAAKGPDIDKVNGSISTDSGREYGDLETVNGSINVDDGVKAEEVSTVNGGIRLRSGAVVDSAETVNGGITIDEKVLVNRDVSTVNGGISVDRGSQVDGGMETVNGGMKLRAATVEQGLRTVNGSIEVGADSIVRGGILVEKPSGWVNWGKSSKPRITIGANAVVEGELRFEHEVELYIDPSAKVGKQTGVSPIMLDAKDVER